MMTDFYESFGNNSDEDTEIPREVLEELNKDLPVNLTYIQIESGRYRVVPKLGCPTKPVCYTIQFDFDSVEGAGLFERLKNVSSEKWDEYFYRSQKSVAVKNIKIGDDEQLIPLEQTLKNPLKDEQVTLKDLRMYPGEFPDPTPMLFETEEGDKVTLSFQQQSYDSLTEIKFSNVDFPALKIEFYEYSPLTDEPDEGSKTNENNKNCITYSVTPSKAPSVTAAVVALRIFSGLLKGTVKVNGRVLISRTMQSEFDAQRIEDVMSFWSTAEKLEEKLGVTFDPNAAFPMEDVEFFNELAICLNEKKQIIWKHPFDHFHITGYRPQSEDGNTNDTFKDKKIYFQFLEGPISCTLLGAEFNIYSCTKMTDLVITNIEWDDDEKQDGEVYITDAPGKVWELKRLYITEEDAEMRKSKHDSEPAI